MERLFRYSSDRVPTLLILLMFGLDLLVYLLVDDWRLLLVWLMLGVAPKTCICAWNHHHQHLSTFNYNWMNRLLEIVYALHTGITSNAWVLHHVLGHHVNYLDQTKDESAWARKDGSTMGTFEYTMTIALTGYFRAFRVGRKHPRYRPAFISMGLLVALVLCGLIYYRPLAGIMVFALPMLIGYIITCWHTYYHHAGLHSEDPYSATYNITHKWYNILTGNLGYHTAHHVKQALHWSLLPEFHSSIEEKIPEELYRNPPIPFKWMPST